MLLYYYWITSTNECTKRIMRDEYMGEIGDHVIYDNIEYIISDYTFESINLESVL